MDAAAIRGVLAENKWRCVEGAWKEGVRPDTITRYIAVENREDVDGFIAYLKTYVSANNKAAATTVVNPMAGTQWEQTGTWTGGAIYLKEVDRDAGGGKELRIYQELFSGETSIGTLTIENGCRWKVEITETFFGKTSLPAAPASTAGVNYQIHAFQVDPHNKTYSGYIEKRTRVAQDVAEYDSELSAADAIRTTKKLGTTDEAALPIALTAGKIMQREVGKNEDCTFDVEKREIVPADQTATSGVKTHLHSSVRVSHTENSSTPAVPATVAAGQIKKVESAPTRAGKLRTEEETDTATAVSQAEFVSRYGENETEYLSEEIHAAAAPAIVDETASGIATQVLAYNLDDYLTHNYKVLRTVSKFPFSGEVSWEVFGGFTLSTTQVYSETLGRYWNNKTYVTQTVEKHTLKYFKTAAEAAAFITGAFLTDSSGSSFSHTGPFEYLAHKVVHSGSLVATYEYVEPVE